MGKTLAGDYVERFERRAEIYSRNRPGYPHRVILLLRSETGFGPEKIVADIGSGTGILSELFLKNGNMVYSVEPNSDMRRVAEKNLERFSSKFVSVQGRAEATTLTTHSVDLVVAGQALHWFDADKARAEFDRILRQDGYVGILYNHRRERGEVERAYAEIVDKYAKNRAPVPEVDEEYVAKFLMNNEFRKFVTPNFQILDSDGMLGRMASASYMPNSDSQEWPKLEDDVNQIIQTYGRNGVVKFHYDTVMYLGRISHAFGQS